jgi:hypothetical protein
MTDGYQFPSTAPATNQSAAAGDKFSANMLPWKPQGRLVDDLKKYAGVQGFKAVAIAVNGMGIATGSTNFVTQTEADRAIQQQCELLSNLAPCVIFAEGDFVKYDSADVLSHVAPIIDSGARTFDMTRVPMIISKNPYYINPASYSVGALTFKAFAIGDYGRMAHGTGVTQYEADQRALQACEGIDGSPCTLYAEGDTVVFNATVFSWKNFFPALQYTGSFQASEVPFIADADAKAVAAAIQSAPPNSHWALAVSRYGDFFLATDATSTAAALEAIAVTNCNLKISAGLDYSCILYSADGQLLWSIMDVKAHNAPSSAWN